MKQHKSYKLRIYPNKSQTQLIEKTFGCVRFIYNTILDYKIKAYEHSNINYHKFQASNDITQIKKIEGYEFLKEVDANSLINASNDLDQAYQNFFKYKKGYPNFKSKNRSKNSYRANQNREKSLKIEGSKIKIPKLGWVKFRDKRLILEQIKNVTVSKNKVGHYFASILVEYDFESKKPNQIDISKIFSGDMSCKDFIVSEEMEFENQRFYRKKERRLKIRQRRHSKTKKGSNNREKVRHKLAKTYLDITNQRVGYQRKVANELVSKFDVLVFEDLNIKGMQSFNKGISKTVTLDFSWSEFLTYLEWKCKKHDKYFIKIDRFFPSSKLCHECGTVKDDLTLSHRVYTCDCGYVEDRDINAAKNIKREGINALNKLGVNLFNPTEADSESYACGNMSDVSCSAQEPVHNYAQD